MKKEDVEIGIKVVPFQKTAHSWGNLNSSNIWYDAKRKAQPFLYVTGWDGEEDAWLLNITSEVVDGDFFRSEDFELYLE